MVALFHDMIHREIEVYVDDMIAKSQTDEEHLDHRQKLFDRSKTYKLRLNPNKCTFGVRSGKLLSIIGILILCAGLIFSGIDLITTSSTVYRIIIAIITEVVALVFIFK